MPAQCVPPQQGWDKFTVSDDLYFRANNTTRFFIYIVTTQAVRIVSSYNYREPVVLTDKQSMHCHKRRLLIRSNIPGQKKFVAVTTSIWQPGGIKWQ